MNVTRHLMRFRTRAVLVSVIGVPIAALCRAAPPTTQPGAGAPETRPAASNDLRDLLGVNPGMKRADLTKLPTMSLRGFVKREGQPPIALLEIAELNRDFLVQAGTEIPITVQGRVTAMGHSELTGLAAPNKPQAAPAPADNSQESQIILRVLKVSSDGVVVETGLQDQTITVR